MRVFFRINDTIYHSIQKFSQLQTQHQAQVIPLNKTKHTVHPNTLLQMLAADTPFSKRLTQCTCAVVWCLLCGGPIFGFAALKPILIKEHVYESLCDLHPETTTSLVRSAASEVVAKCTSFPERSGTILAMLTGAFDASSAVFLLYRIVYNKSIPSLGS